MPKPPRENHQQGSSRLVFCKKTIRAGNYHMKPSDGNQHRKKKLRSPMQNSWNRFYKYIDSKLWKNI